MKKQIHKEKLRSFTVLFQPAEEGGYNVFVPELPGCMTQGETLDEARHMAEDAIRSYCASLAKDDLPIPHTETPIGQFVGVIDVRLNPT
ncbi:type II toxin-antitoxin system HicB family antitoxin [Candidatus Uhrbacteria bacterium]|nr:type II toxin-antitoxin system HicB family antitoxin [Candidatus Uhrbacteria bacterium]